MNRLQQAVTGGVLALAAAAIACGGSGQPATESAGGSAAAGAVMQINGAGATFPNPIYSKWFDEYHKAKPNVQINYQPIGSGGGIRQITAETVFFGATDSPLTDEQAAAAPGQRVVKVIRKRVIHFTTSG